MYSDDSVSRVCGIGSDDVEAESVIVQDELVEGGGAVVNGVDGMVVVVGVTGVVRVVVGMTGMRVNDMGGMVRVDGRVEVVKMVQLV